MRKMTSVIKIKKASSTSGHINYNLSFPPLLPLILLKVTDSLQYVLLMCFLHPCLCLLLPLETLFNSHGSSCPSTCLLSFRGKFVFSNILYSALISYFRDNIEDFSWVFFYVIKLAIMCGDFEISTRQSLDLQSEVKVNILTRSKKALFLPEEKVTMEQRLTVDAITPQITEWTCKIQVVDRFCPRESKDQAVHFQTIIVQDENEEQVCIVLYGDDIGRCHKLFELFDI